MAVGAALATRYDRSGRVVVVAFRDGATNQGRSRAMNFAAAFALPVVFVCENNSYSELTPIADMSVNRNCGGGARLRHAGGADRRQQCGRCAGGDAAGVWRARSVTARPSWRR